MCSSTSQNFFWHRFDEQVNLVLKSSDPEKLPELSRKFVRVSALATITHLKKFIAIKVLNMPKDDEDIFRDIDITCEGELIPKDHTLKFVYVTRWRTKDPPLHLVYRYLCSRQNFETQKSFYAAPRSSLTQRTCRARTPTFQSGNFNPNSLMTTTRIIRATSCYCLLGSRDFLNYFDVKPFWLNS